MCNYLNQLTSDQVMYSNMFTVLLGAVCELMSSLEFQQYAQLCKT